MNPSKFTTTAQSTTFLSPGTRESSAESDPSSWRTAPTEHSRHASSYVEKNPVVDLEIIDAGIDERVHRSRL